MDYEDLCEHQGRHFDDLLMAAVKIPDEGFTEPGPAGGPSLRNLLVQFLDIQRRHVHETIGGRRHVPLVADRIRSPYELGPLFGGFRLTLRDAVGSLSHDDLQRTVTIAGEDGAERTATIDEVLVDMVLTGARLCALAAERLRQLGQPVTPPFYAAASDGGPAGVTTDEDDFDSATDDDA